MDWCKPEVKGQKKAKKEKKDEKEEWEPERKERKPISVAGAKKILGIDKADAIVGQWVDRWVEDLVRSNSYPPQLMGDTFLSLLNSYFPPMKALDILTSIRKEYHRAFDSRTEDDGFQFLLDAIQNDPEAQKAQKGDVPTPP